jgi:uncharacterized cupredoxin-like copper-binding protein
MKLHRLTLALTASLLVAGSALAHEGESHAAPAATAGHAHAEGHEHGHDDTDVIGVAGQADKVTRTINVDMTDAMRFNPSSVSVRQGETIRFVVNNSGHVKHELVLGTEAALKEHYELMKKFPEMEHADPNQITVAPGQTGEVIWQFTQAGQVDFACLQPGHYDAGMKGIVRVAAGKPAKGSGGHAADHKH